MTEGNGTKPNQKAMTIIVTKSSLDWAYPPFILATTAEAMGVNTTMFFTFYGLPFSSEEAGPENLAHGQPGDENADGRDAHGHAELGFRDPRCGFGGNQHDEGHDQEEGRPSIEELRDMAREADVKLIACQIRATNSG